VRVGTPLASLKEVFQRHVVQLHADRADEHIGAPTARYLELVAGHLLERERNIDQLVGIGNQIDARARLLRVEVLHLVQLTDRLHQQRTVVQFAGPHVQLATNHPVVDPVIPGNLDLVDFGLLALEYLHVDIDRVLSDDHLSGIDAGEQIAVVLIQRADRGHVLVIGMLADTQSLVERLLVVSLALADSEHVVQLPRLVDAVTGPRHVPVIELIPFVDFQGDSEPLVVDPVHGVAENRRIAVTPRVVEVDQVLLVLFVVLFLIFGPFEYVDALLVRFLERAAQLPVGERRVALEIDLADLDPVLAVDDEKYVHDVFKRRIVLEPHADVRIVKPFLGKILANGVFRAVQDKIGKLATFLQLERFEQLAHLPLADTLYLPVVNPGSLPEDDLDIDAVAYGLRKYLHVGIDPLVPHCFQRRRQIVARYHDRIALGKARHRSHDLRIEILDPTDFHLIDNILLGVFVIEHRSIPNLSRRVYLSRYGNACQ